MPHLRHIVIACLVMLGAFCHAGEGMVRLAPGVPILVEAGEPPALLRAVEDLRRDLEAVLGRPSEVVRRVEDLAGRPALVVTTRGTSTAPLRDAAIGGREAHGIHVRNLGTVPCVVLQGADLRGGMYAVYEFSDRFLDVPPLHRWAEWKPARREEVVIPASTAIRIASPAVAWRVWFPNDMDLYRGWRKASPGNTSDIIFETMLRLKYNAVSIGQNCWDYQEDEDQKGFVFGQEATARGIALFSPYIAALSLWKPYWTKVRQLPEAPPIRLADTSKFEEFWTYSIKLAQREQFEMLWCLNFRGASDAAFWKTVPDAPTETAERAQVVADLMARQYALLKRLYGAEQPLAVAQLYSETMDLFRAGHLKPPAGPNVIWQLSNDTRDHYPANSRAELPIPADQRYGYYFNIQFFTTGCHMADGEGPWKMEANYRRMGISPDGSLAFGMVNVGNVREFLLTISAAGSLFWNPSSYRTDGFLDAFCRRYFGAQHGASVAGIYRDYFAAYWQQRKGDLSDIPRQYIFSDLRMDRVGRGMLARMAKFQYYPDFIGGGTDQYKIIPADSSAASEIEAVRLGMEASAAAFAGVAGRCDDLLPLLPDQAKTLFNDSLRQRARFMTAASRWLLATSTAYRAMAGPNPPAKPGVLKTPERAQPIPYLRQAAAAVDAMQAILAELDHGIFAGWHADHTAFKAIRQRSQIETAISVLDGTVPPIAAPAKPPAADAD